MNRWIAPALIALLYVFHQDFWFWRETRPLAFGFMPIGLFYHAVFTVVCALVMWLLVTRAWPAHLESSTPDDRASRSGPPRP
jgi:uncharacterized protein DUF3311